jgi:putative membrane protein
MYVRNGPRLLALLWAERWHIAVIVALAALTETIEPYVPENELFSVVYVGVFSAALSIFLVFRFNEAYERWWEARTLWGTLVNSSRDLAREVLTLLEPEQAEAAGRTLIYRQIAFVHALRVRLREAGSARGDAETGELLQRLLPAEADQYKGSQNVPNMLLLAQSQQVAQLLRGATADNVLLARFDDTLGRLHDVQGGCERIKNTVFPATVSLITRALVWSLVGLLLLATLTPDGRGGIMPTVAVVVMALAYLLIDTLGRDLMDPFEGRPNDTPMQALSVGIERDLREMLGESELPEPVAPIRGVLL